MTNRRVRSKIELTLSKDQSLGEIREREMKTRLQLEESQSRLDELTGQVKEAEKSRRQLNAEIERKEAEIRNQKSQLRETENNLKREQDNNQRLKKVSYIKFRSYLHQFIVDISISMIDQILMKHTV